MGTTSKPAHNVNPSKQSSTDQLPRFNQAGFIGAISVGFFFLAIRLVLGQDSFVTIHDNLDSEIPWRLALADNAGSDWVYSIMNGLPVSFMVTRLNLVYAFFAVLPPFTAYVWNEAVVHAVAFAGMFLLLRALFRKGLLRSGQERLIAAGVALAFSFLPFYSIYGLTIAGQPLLLVCLLNLEARQGLWFSYGFIGLYCFYSSLVLVGIFVLAVLGCYSLGQTLKTRTLSLPLWSGLALLAISYGISEAKLIQLLLYRLEPSHRDAWDLMQMSYPLKEAFTRTLRDFLVGQYHTASQHLGILGLGLGTILLSWQRPAAVSPRKRLLGLLVAVSMLAVLSGFHNWNGLIPIKERFLFLKTFNFSRFYWFQPLLWHLVLALALTLLCERFNGKKWLVAALALQLLFTIGSPIQAENELRTNLRLVGARITGTRPNNVVTYREFVSAAVFQQVKQAVGKPPGSYRVISLGIPPAVAQLNGFYTLDSYQNNYPLRYKLQFREIIAPELAKSTYWRAYFDGWGSRCYVFSAEVPKLPSHQTRIHTLQLNYAALSRMGGQYLFSAFEIENAPQTGLKLLGTFEAPNPEHPLLYVYSTPAL
jgi:hypothetical protein